MNDYFAYTITIPALYVDYLLSSKFCNLTKTEDYKLWAKGRKKGRGPYAYFLMTKERDMATRLEF